MFGDDPDPTVTTARVGSGTAFGRVREGPMHCAKRGRHGPRWTVESGLYWEKRGEMQPDTISGDKKRPTLDRL